ncbi:TetR/AcrR family transcriptional regulator [Microbacterium excoecariae]|uniref:TetR/AcrR family transcriptional regulator n=1 Tax=Microbacterium excoecariae TaxID=2715210 RepID=UPI00140844E9|nr:TetR/AcrR family transcriptional regulator [Microbacterium excoecariae]NHI16609.1 TetR/AcrR family transcriptional regulator [Microbacterium excoecariae]
MSISASQGSDDPRAVRTRARLADALVRLLSREDLASIGVAELCREAGVHRTTFYGHYASVGDLAAAVFASMLDEVSAIDVAPGTSLAELSRVYADGTVAILTAVARERGAIRALLDSAVSLGFRKRLREHLVRRAEIAIENMRHGGIDLPADTRVEAAVIAGGVVSAIELWASLDDAHAAAFADRIVANMPRWWPAAG